MLVETYFYIDVNNSYIKNKNVIFIGNTVLSQDTGNVVLEYAINLL